MFHVVGSIVPDYIDMFVKHQNEHTSTLVTQIRSPSFFHTFNVLVLCSKKDHKPP